MDSRTKQAIAALVLGFLSFSAAPADYLTNLRTLAGTPYSTLNCSRYIETAKHAKHCGAAGMWTGCNGQATVIAEFATKNFDRSILRAGDVLDFHGVHVAAFVGDGFMDSDPSHSGVGVIHLRTKTADPWFAGPVRIVRWNS